MQALVVRPDGTHKRIDLTLENIKAALDDGWLELVKLTTIDGHEFNGYIDEEGKLKGLRTNSFASALYHFAHGPGDVIVGPVVIFGKEVDDDGDETGLTDEEFSLLEASLQ